MCSRSLKRLCRTRNLVKTQSIPLRKEFLEAKNPITTIKKNSDGTCLLVTPLGFTRNKCHLVNIRRSAMLLTPATRSPDGMWDRTMLRSGNFATYERAYVQNYVLWLRGPTNRPWLPEWTPSHPRRAIFTATTFVRVAASSCPHLLPQSSITHPASRHTHSVLHFVVHQADVAHPCLAIRRLLADPPLPSADATAVQRDTAAALSWVSTVREGKFLGELKYRSHPVITTNDHRGHRKEIFLHCAG